MNKKAIGIIGTGKHFNKKIFPILYKSDFFQIKGILRKKKSNFKNIKYFNEKNFFKRKFDFIYIACPNKYHEQYIIKSLMSGSHVICEKPFVMRKKNINKINKLAKIKEKLIFESFMYVYHPAFKYIEKLIKSKKYGKLRYVISNFRFPSLDKNNNRYNKNEGGGFFYDAAVYLVSLENYLFNKKSKLNFTSYSQKIKNTVDLRGNIYINSKEGNRFYFWGEGQNYSNNLEIFFEKSTVFVDKFFSKKNNERIYIKIFFKNKLKKISIAPSNQVEKMFDEIRCNYNSKSFQNFHRKKITNQINLLLKCYK